MADGLTPRFLKTSEGNALIGAINALLNRKVVLNASNEQESRHDVAEANSLITITRRDLVNAIGLDTLAARNVNGPPELPGDLQFTGGGVDVFTPGSGYSPGAPVVFQDGGWKPVVAVSVNVNGSWIGADCDAAATEFRSQSGSGTLIGFSEYTDPSAPPKKYRRQTVSGTYQVCASFASLSCRSTPTSGFAQTATFAGYAQYDKDTGILTNTNVCNYGGNNVDTHGPCDPQPLVNSVSVGAGYVCPGPVDGTSGAFPQTIFTSNEQKNVGTGVCGDDPTYGTANVIITGSVDALLTDEDTEQDAIARAVVGAGYDAPARSVATNTDASRAAGVFSFSFTSVEWRASATGLVPGDNYIAGVVYGRRAAGSSGTFTQFASDSIPFTAAGGIDYTPWTAIPNESGFDTTVLSVQICPA